jgi:hypothetical protein
MDDTWLKETLDAVMKQHEEIRTRMKVRGLPPESICWKYKGTKFIYVLDPQWEERSVGGQVPPQGSGGACSTASKRPMFNCIIISSRSTEPGPYEKWTR